MKYKKIAFVIGLVIMTALVLMTPRLSRALRGAVTSPSITNPIQGLQVTKVSFNDYGKAINTQIHPDTPIVNLQLRDYVLTLKNTSNQPILAYHIAFVSPKDPNARHSLISFPIFTKEDFAPGTEITKEIKAIPPDYEMEVRAVIFQGLASEGDASTTRQLVARLEGAREKIKQIRDRVEEVSKLSDRLAEGATENLAVEIATERANLEKAYKKFSAMTPKEEDDVARAFGQIDALGIAQLNFARVTNTGPRPKASAVLQRIDNQLTRLQ